MSRIIADTHCSTLRGWTFRFNPTEEDVERSHLSSLGMKCDRPAIAFLNLCQN
ncbi:hypothetical protein [Allocoleopsis sp.]|uniref:hypothetical protein n=1 Tax=Allocoleopsis sp. TaxID=3088169 RepID=UPI002FCED8ED